MTNIATRFLDATFDVLSKPFGDWPAFAIMVIVPALGFGWLGWWLGGWWVGAGVFILSGCVVAVVLLAIALNGMDDREYD